MTQGSVFEGKLQVLLRGLIASGVIFALQYSALAQRKPERAEAPKFTNGQFKNIFFSNPAEQLKGPRPTGQATASVKSNAGTPKGKPEVQSSDSPESATSDPLAWHNLISPTSLEDLVKDAKLRLDKVVTTPAAFAGGGFVGARRDFSLLALLFAIIEKHPGDVRWKNSAATARSLMARVASNSKVGSQQVYAEAKKRLQDLADLTNGTPLNGDNPGDVAWSQLMDRVPLMQLINWAQQEQLNGWTSNPSEFNKHRDEIQKLAELVAILGKASLIEEMPDAGNADYVEFAKEMIEHSRQLAEAAKTNNAELARQSAGKLGQSCVKCHDVYR